MAGSLKRPVRLMDRTQSDRANMTDIAAARELLTQKGFMMLSTGISVLAECVSMDIWIKKNQTVILLVTNDGVVVPCISPTNPSEQPISIWLRQL